MSYEDTRQELIEITKQHNLKWHQYEWPEAASELVDAILSHPRIGIIGEDQEHPPMVFSPQIKCSSEELLKIIETVHKYYKAANFRRIVEKP